MQADSRILVKFPEPLLTHTLANMRDHLAALGEMQNALANGEYDRAAEVAEQRLGMSSLKTHGAHEVAEFMPKGMQCRRQHRSKASPTRPSRCSWRAQ